MGNEDMSNFGEIKVNIFYSIHYPPIDSRAKSVR